MNPIFYTVFHTKTIFIPLRYLYGECNTLIDPYPQVTPLQCLDTSCPVDMQCMHTLVHRVDMLFNKVPDAKMMVAYFKLPSGRIRAGIFHSDHRAPYLRTCNPSAMKKFQKEGTTFQWFPTEDYYLYKKPEQLIRPESLIRP